MFVKHDLNNARFYILRRMSAEVGVQKVLKSSNSLHVMAVCRQVSETSLEDCLRGVLKATCRS